MATRNIYLNVEILAAVRVTLPDGSTGTHLLVDEKDVPAIKASALADFIEGDVEEDSLDSKGNVVKGKEKIIPAKWLSKEGTVLHSYLGLDIQTTQMTAKIGLPIVDEKLPK